MIRYPADPDTAPKQAGLRPASNIFIIHYIKIMSIIFSKIYPPGAKTTEEKRKRDPSRGSVKDAPRMKLCFGSANTAAIRVFGYKRTFCRRFVLRSY